MYSSADWLNGKTCATLLATIGGEGSEHWITLEGPPVVQHPWLQLPSGLFTACACAVLPVLAVQLLATNARHV
jgi:hypothetical protein